MRVEFIPGKDWSASVEQTCIKPQAAEDLARVSQLKGNGADIDAKSKFDRAPFQVAAEQETVKAVEMPLNCISDINPFRLSGWMTTLFGLIVNRVAAI